MKKNSLRIEPETVTFVGFQVLKANMYLIKVINQTSTQRYFQIFQPITNFFNLLYQRRNYIPPNSYIDMYVKFTPIQNREYSDCFWLKFQETYENIKVELQAFPSLNSEITAHLEKEIQFDPVRIGTPNPKKTFVLNSISKVPIFVHCSLSNQQFFKVQPVKVELFLQVPQCFTIQYLNAYVGKHECKCVISFEEEGVNPFEMKLIGQTIEYEGKTEPSLKNVLKSSSRFSQKNLRTFSQFKIKSRYRTSYSDLKQRQFLAKIEQINNFDREKLIKISIFLGDPIMGQIQIKNIIEERDLVLKEGQCIRQKQSINRKITEFDNDIPLVDFQPLFDCNWNQKRNLTNVIKNLKIADIKKQVSRIMFNHRVSKRLILLKSLTTKFPSELEMKKHIHAQWMEDTIFQQQRSKPITFKLRSQNLETKIKMPVCYEQESRFNTFQYEITEKRGFSDWVLIESISQPYTESMRYSVISLPSVISEYTIEAKRQMRKGCPIENAFRAINPDVTESDVFGTIKTGFSPKKQFFNWYGINNFEFTMDLSDQTDSDYIFTKAQLQSNSYSPFKQELNNKENHLRRQNWERMRILRTSPFCHLKWLNEEFPERPKFQGIPNQYLIGLYNEECQVQMLEGPEEGLYLDEKWEKYQGVSFEQLRKQWEKEGSRMSQLGEDYDKDQKQVENRLGEYKRRLNSSYASIITDLNTFIEREENKIPF